MIPRYTRKEMEEIWSEEKKFETWLRVELTILEAKEKLKMIPVGVSTRIRNFAKFAIERIKELEKILKHDLMAFVANITENLPDDCKPYFHGGVTSYDIEDTALAILMVRALNLIIEDLKGLMKLVLGLAWSHKHTLQIGRTHGVHAEPITFGLKLLRFYDELDRHLDRLKELKKRVGVIKISGAVGTYANIDPRIERIVAKKLGLRPARISSQIIARDRHAEYVSILALVATSLENFATEIRNLARTEIREVQEKFSKGQKGSSAMPHKRNPVSSENTSSLARLMRGLIIPALENMITWHERDLANSGNERIIIPDASILLDYMLSRFAGLLEELNIYPENMKKNLELTSGVIASQQVMLALAEKGMAREEAHTLVQGYALQAFDEGKSFKQLLLSNEGISRILSGAEIDVCLDPKRHLEHIDTIFNRFSVVPE